MAETSDVAGAAGGWAPRFPWRSLVAGLVLAATAIGQTATLQRLVAEAEAKGVRTGCIALAPLGEQPLFSHRVHDLFAPASNLKVLTAVAALRGLGPGYEFTTEFRVRDGELVVQAGGDPNWSAGGDHDPATIFGRVAAALREAGVEVVRGVRLDLGPFTGPARPAGWPQDQLQFSYCPPTGGLVLEAGCFRARIAPTGGDDAAIEVLAPLPIPVDGSIALTSDKRRGSRYSLHERDGRLVAGGAYWRRAPAREVVGTLEDPAAVFEAALRRALVEGGVAIDAEAPAGPDLDLLTYRTTLQEALVPMLEDSSNFHAEQVARVLGAATTGDGSIAGGCAASRAQLEALLGPLPDGVQLLDGSGLSHDNRVTPSMIARVLAAAQQRDWYERLLDAFPAPGEGTLRHRFDDVDVHARVRAKTGWIRGASALSGVVGQRPFSILMNYDPSRAGLNAELKDLQERMVAAIAAMDGA